MMRRVAVAGCAAVCGAVSAYSFVSPSTTRGRRRALPTVVASSSGAFRGASTSTSGGGETVPYVDGQPWKEEDPPHGYDYDLVVIGGGSGGLAAAKRAANHGARVALCDFVTPTVHGTTWGLGGTCVNVGCIPKKLMHQAALMTESINHDAASYGLIVPEDRRRQQTTTDGAAPDPSTSTGTADSASLRAAVSWEVLQRNVDMHIRKLCFGYSGELRSNDVKYFNAFASFVDPHRIAYKDKWGKTGEVSARRFLLAPGGRPSKMGIPGEEHAITSDDLFRRKQDPKRTLVVGGGYIALECAGFLHGIGRSPSVVMRSIPLRGMDRDMAGRAAGYMERLGIPIRSSTVPTKIEKNDDDGTLRVTLKTPGGSEVVETYDTVLVAVGRSAQVDGLNLDAAGVALPGGKIEVDRVNRTTAPHIYALGDAIQGALELTPVAIQAGRALADRLFAGGTQLSDMRDVPTTVFTPLEYGFVGLSEEQALAEHGEAQVEVYHQEFQPLEWSLPQKPADGCYMKLVVHRPTDRVLGFHVLAPGAGEMTQGIGIAMKAGVQKKHFDACIGIHPTMAEIATTLRITKASGDSPAAGVGC